MIARPEPTYVPIGDPRNVAMTSLDKYIMKRKELKPTPLLPPDSPNDNPSETIAQLQKDQSVLCEELNSERRRSESLKSTFARAQSLSSSQLNQKLSNIQKELSLVISPSGAVTEALTFITNVIDQESQFTPGTLRASTLQQKGQISANTAKLQKENEKLLKELKKMTSEKEELQKRLEELNADIESISASKKELVEKYKYFYETFKKRDQQWKEKIERMQERIEGSTQE